MPVWENPSLGLVPENESACPCARKELAGRQQWVNWSPETRRNGIAKPPYVPGSRVRADTSNPTTWGTYQSALKAVESGQHTGIGFVFSEDDPYTGIDLDNCRYPPTGRIDVWALYPPSAFTRKDREPPAAAYPLAHLGDICSTTNRQAEAEELYTCAIEIWERHKPDSYRIAQPLNNLGVLYAAQGKFAEAEPLIERALQVREENGRKYPGLCPPLHNLAYI